MMKNIDIDELDDLRDEMEEMMQFIFLIIYLS